MRQAVKRIQEKIGFTRAHKAHAAMLSRRTPFNIRPHHAKPVRKRHVISLSMLLFLAGTLGLAAAGYAYERSNRQLSATMAASRQLDSLNVRQPASTTIALRSTLGFNLSFNPRLVSVTATEVTAAGEARSFEGENVSTPRPYAAVQVVPSVRDGSGGDVYDRSTMTVFAPADAVINADETGLRKLVERYAPKSDTGSEVALTHQSSQAIGGTTFVKYTYTHLPKVSANARLKLAPATSYVLAGALPDGRAVVVKINGVGSATTPLKLYEQVLSTFSVSTPSAKPSAALPQLESRLPKPKLISLAERLKLSAQVSAADNTVLDNSRIVAANAPAVVKIYHIVCGGVTYRGQPLLEDGCQGGTGSGFLISSDGYIATNGHVVASVAKDMVASSLNATTLARMLQIEGYPAAEIVRLTADIGSDQAAQASVMGAIVKLDDNLIRFTNQQDFYIVALSSEIPDLDQILKQRSFKESAYVKTAQLKAIDYNFNDLYSERGFTRSDVAVLKISGTNYPVVRLGGLDTVVQGASVTVIGFPSDAESSNLVNNDRLQATATQGIVSAIRESSGNSRRIIQSDVKIGHGNSGGPALDAAGRAFGIATYILSGKSGEAGISYLRDIQDLKDLLAAHSISLRTNSSSQAAWDAGLTAFYDARYTSAIKHFQRAGALYMPNLMTGQYISLAQTKIANGEEARGAGWLYALIAGLIACLIGAVVVIVLMVRHRAHHHMFWAAAAGYVRGPLLEAVQVHHRHPGHLVK